MHPATLIGTPRHTVVTSFVLILGSTNAFATLHSIQPYRADSILELIAIFLVKHDQLVVDRSRDLFQIV